MWLHNCFLEVVVLLDARVARPVFWRAEVVLAHEFEHVDGWAIVEVFEALHILKKDFRLRPIPI